MLVHDAQGEGFQLRAFLFLAEGDEQALVAEMCPQGIAAFAAGPPDADAVISTVAGEVIAVRTADCLPVLLCSGNGDEIAAAHCGWRSLSGGLIANTIEKMATSPNELIAWSDELVIF